MPSWLEILIAKRMAGSAEGACRGPAGLGALRDLHRDTHVQFVEQHSIRGAVGSRLCCLPELLLRRVAVHGTQLEQAI